MKLYSILNLMKTLWALGQRIDLDHGWDFIQALKFKCLELFLKYHPSQSFGMKMWFSIKKKFNRRVDYNIFDLRWLREAHTSVQCTLNRWQRLLYSLPPPITQRYNMHTNVHTSTLHREHTYIHMCTHSHFVPEKLKANMHKYQFNIQGYIFHSGNTEYGIMNTSITLSLLANEEQRNHF